MDMYSPETFHATENFNATEYFCEYSTKCMPMHESVENIFNGLIGDTKPNMINFDRIERICSIENFKLPDEPTNLPIHVPKKISTKTKLDPILPISDSARHLNVIKVKESFDKKFNAISVLLGTKRFIKSIMPQPDHIGEVDDLVPGNEFVYTMLWYRPFSFHHGVRNSTEKLRFKTEIDILGSNFLSDVIDKIECPADTMILPEVENTKVDIQQFKDARRWYPSRFLFINGVFYNDMRQPNAVDLSPKIIKWAADKNIGNFTTAKMDETRFCDLKPRLGYPYVYVHQGDCEHIFVFADARLLQSRDCLVSKMYPRTLAFNNDSNNMCSLCLKRVVKWTVRKCDRLPHEKVFLCTDCCDSYLYIDGKKVTDFRLYPMFNQSDD
ncbi:snRNA-activating protein complex subunit 3 [Diabrotica virgifera virgifera]|uniref:snRNA-activating protein complex subunit 3 n=1 Tax=Diabrotica virgifera virgifera TaxID=50390 RepID=A0A6P7FNN4_DIAVI|nr:snRNA-activating protein complex subunit 3 [Diabrotica virgifera virgifera]XP_028134623.1 snRNA-activating protein complex subunit 3 [Diabrotica virgifera virgifera]